MDGVKVRHLIEGEEARVEADNQQVGWLMEGRAGDSGVVLREQVPIEMGRGRGK